ncbi:immunoglobulin superfamily member 10 [Octodon degus]|uniref:immunoglobulin superfamily member 10 n=1 Tax=Octodon degus TaxID=10160 RepID=UPI0003339B78|nr:immunoglobulin superfamily member 10 [Octodon degus]
MKVKGREISYWLISCTTMCLVVSPGSRACPRRCACYIATEVHCTFRYLTSIPDGISPDVERMNLGYNSLIRLTETDFSGLNKLELLMLHSNGIHTVADKTFSDLQALQVLKMSYNKVRKLQRDTFYGLKSLTRLHMDHNSIEFINPEVFYGLTSLRLVHLEGNQLTKLHPDTFVSLRYLQIFKMSFIKYLYLSDNFLTSVPEEMVSYMPDLESLYLHGNPWTCDCHLKWLSDWIQRKPDVVKCKKDRSPSRSQQCPLCTNPRIFKGKAFASVPASAFQCLKPAIDPSLKSKSLTILEDNGPASVSPQDFLAPLGSLTLNITDQNGNEANLACSIQKPQRSLPTAFTEENDNVVLSMSISTFLVCSMDSNHIQPVWQVLALYSDSPLILERSHLVTEAPQLCYRYKQVAPKPEDVFTNIEADLSTDPAWLMQGQISLQLDRNATTFGTLQIHYSSDAQVTSPRAEVKPVKHKWTMISRLNNTKMEHTLLVGETIALDCPGQGDPTPHLEWLLADGNKVRAPYVSEDGRILIDKSGKLELQMADSFDTGVYHCISTNYEDADILTYRITVVEPNVEAAQENGIHRTVFIGDTLDLPCHSTGIPDASVSWVLPGNIVLYQSSKNKQILNNDTLRIFHITQKDQGHYFCVAANPLGIDALAFQVSVKIKDQRPEEQDVDADGSGFDARDASTHHKDLPAVQLPTATAVRTDARRVVSKIRKKDSHQEFLQRQHGDSTNQRFREQRRQFLPSARRIDPQHWAAFLDKARKNAEPEKQEHTTAKPPPPVTQLVKISAEEEELSGMLSPDEEFIVLATRASRVPATPHSLVTNIASGTKVSPLTSPQILQPTIKITKNVNPTISSKVQDTTNQNPATIFPLLSGVTVFHEVDQEGRRENFLSVPPIKGKPVTNEVHIKMPGNINRTVSTPLESVNPTDGHETSVTRVSEPRRNHFYSHISQNPRISPVSPDPHTAVHSQFQIFRNNTAVIPLPRRFGRRRKIWGRGRMTSPFRNPVLRWHRYGTVKPASRGPAAESTTAFSAPELHVMCPSCLPRQRLASTTTALLFAGPSPTTLPKANKARGTTEESTTLIQNPSLLFENKSAVDVERMTPTIQNFSPGSTQETSTGTVLMYSSRSVAMEKTLTVNNGCQSMSSTSEAKRDSEITLPLSHSITKPPKPTTIGITRFSRRKIPWDQIFVNKHNPKVLLKNLHKFGLPKSKATMLPKISPALPTNKFIPLHSTTLSVSLTQIPSATLSTVHHNITATYSPQSILARREPPVAPFYPVFPSITSKKSSTISFTSVQTTPATLPTASASIIINKIQTAMPRAQKEQKIEVTPSRNDPNITSGQSPGIPTSATVLPPVLSTTKTSINPNISVVTHSFLEDTSRILGKIGQHSRTNVASGTAELPQENTLTLEGTVDSGTTLTSKSEQNATTRKTMTSPSTMIPLLGSSAPLMSMPTPPPSTQGVITVGTPVLAVTNTMDKLHESSRNDMNSQQSAAESTVPMKVPTKAEFTMTATHFTYSDLPHSTPTSAQHTTVEPQISKWMLFPQPENQFELKSHPTFSKKEKKPAVSMFPTLSLPEPTSHASYWGGQRNTKKSGFDKKPVKKITSKLLPSDILSRNTFEKPRIVGGNAASFTVPADSDGLLPCEATGNPLPTIHWTRVSSGIELSKRKQNSRFHVFPNGTLSIQKVNIQDRGQYLCSASNRFGTDRLHVTLSVVSYPPRILERHTKEITVHSGSTVELKCRAEGSPSPTISWILANQTLVSEASQRKTRALITSDGTLVIHNLSIYDRGFYKCMANNPAGQDSWLIKIQVIAAPPVILEKKRQDIVGIQGESLTLPCTAKGSPQPTVHWVLFDGSEVKPLQVANSKLLLYSNGSLHIRNIVSADAGTYECIATSSTGSERRVVILTVKEKETIPRIKSASQKWTEVNVGDELLLNCSATGEPKPKIIWRLPSKALVEQWHWLGSQIQVYPNGSLFIGSVTEKDGGDYLCVARNKMGDDLVLMHVSLRRKPARIDHKQHFKKQVLHGKDFQVDCRASGSPVPEISWSLPDGTMINKAMQADDSGHKNKRYTLFNNGTLYFNKVGIAEEGDYTCYAQNTLGKDEMKVHLTVITAAPRIRQGYRTTVRIKAGATAVLDCEVTGEPKPEIFWLLPSNDMISFSSDRYVFHANGSLSINKVKLLDSGEYVCVAQNPSGDDTKTYKLDVTSQPPLINGLYRNKTVMKATAVRHSKKHLNCRAEGTPSPQITWIVPDNIFLTAPYYGSRIKVYKNGTLEIRNLRLSDSADFVCVARNEGGESVLVVQLEVLEMLRRPTFRNPFNEKVVVQLGKLTTLNCSVDGNPPPEIIWILPNGTQISNKQKNSQYLIASNGSLIINKTTRNNAGKYRCAAKNKVGYIEKLIVLEIGQKPVILTYALGIVKSISGESLSLHCVSDGIPKPNVKWTTPSGYTIDRPQINGKYLLHENGTLVIKEAMTYDRGNYICKAQNSVGQALITIPVMIVAYPPRITNPPTRSILTRTGVAFRLHCVALGIPKPEITWERPGHSLLSSTSKRRNPESDLPHPRGTLVIQNPQISDSGTYKCVARNPVGSDYATTYVQVI